MTKDGNSQSEENAGDWRRIDRTLLSVQYLRAIAAIAIVLLHSMPWQPSALQFVESLAVDLFFVISGFIFIMIADDNSRPWPFFRQRLERIVPLYWLASFTAYWIFYSGVLRGVFHPFRELSHLWNGPVELLIGSLLFVPIYNDAAGFVQPIVPQGWTLNYEMMFYLCFSCALLLARRWIVPALTLAFLMIIALGPLAQTVQTRFWTQPLILEFIVGLWVGMAWRRGWDFRLLFLGVLIAWVPVAFATHVLYLDSVMWPGRLVGLPIVMLICLPVIAIDRRKGGLPEWQLARLLGDASYSIYLFHFIGVILATQIDATGPAGRLAYFAVVFCGGTSLGIAVYWFVERPIMRWFRARRKARKLTTSSEESPGLTVGELRAPNP